MAPLFGIYVHWPFCASKCPYCDFNSHVAASIDHEAWRKAYRQEIAHYAALTKGRTVTSIFFGGGTPSLMEPHTAAVVVDEIARHWTLSPDAEITLEANPTSIEAAKFQAFRQAGINRVSVGIQSLNNEDLKFLGRQHNADEARRAIDIAAQNFKRFSFDLIYARPEQTIDQWRAELSDALTLAGDHLSLYQLTIEPGTPFFTQHERGDFRIPDNDRAGEFYEVTQEMMEAAGLPAYEVSNHARAGQESLHNLTYWRYCDYAGVGPGAHGRLTIDGKKFATRGHRAPDVWMKRVDTDGHGSHPFENVTPEQQKSEALMMGLRLREGVREDAFNLDPPKVQKMCDEGFLIRTDGNLRPTTAGLQRLNGLLSYLA